MHTYNIRHKPLPPHWRGTASLEYVLFQIVASRGARIDRMRAHAGQLRHPASVASQKSGYPRAPSCQTYAHSPQATHTHKLHNAPLAHAVRRSMGACLREPPHVPTPRAAGAMWPPPLPARPGGLAASSYAHSWRHGRRMPPPRRAPFTPLWGQPRQRRRPMLLSATARRPVGRADLGVIRSGGGGRLPRPRGAL